MQHAPAKVQAPTSPCKNYSRKCPNAFAQMEKELMQLSEDLCTSGKTTRAKAQATSSPWQRRSGKRPSTITQTVKVLGQMFKLLHHIVKDTPAKDRAVLHK